MAILVTGSAGYIGSHVVDELLKNGIEHVLGIDNLHAGRMSNSLTTCFIEDVRNEEGLRSIFKEHNIDCVMHLAALTSVPESMEKSEEYFDVNYNGTKTLLKVMKEFNCNKLIFSSTASIYEQSQKPVTEDSPAQPLNNYAISKYKAEQEIKANLDWLNAIIFRYFNVIGYREDYDKSAEYSKTNIVPALLRIQVSGETFSIFGNCYPVKRKDPNDKTCVRDYIDVRDIARAHVKAYMYLQEYTGVDLFNLGTKHGISVMELLAAFEKANNTKVPYEIKDKRKGDPASIIADSTKARELLGWEPIYSLEESLKIL